MRPTPTKQVVSFFISVLTSLASQSLVKVVVNVVFRVGFDASPDKTTSVRSARFR